MLSLALQAEARGDLVPGALDPAPCLSIRSGSGCNVQGWPSLVQGSLATWRSIEAFQIASNTLIFRCIGDREWFLMSGNSLGIADSDCYSLYIGLGIGQTDLTSGSAHCCRMSKTRWFLHDSFLVIFVHLVLCHNETLLSAMKRIDKVVLDNHSSTVLQNQPVRLNLHSSC